MGSFLPHAWRRWGIGVLIAGLAVSGCSSSAPTAVKAPGATATSRTPTSDMPPSATTAASPPAGDSASASTAGSAPVSTAASTPVSTQASTGKTSSASSATTASSSTGPSTSRSSPLGRPGRAAALGLKPVTVPVKVLTTKSSVQVLVPVTIHSKPFYFIVDTGATVTFLDSTVAKSLGLRAMGTSGSGTSIGCSSPLQPVLLDEWSIGGQALPGSRLPSEKTQFAGKKYQGVPIAGLLGADLYYLYGTTTLDYRAATLALGRAVPTGKRSFPFTTDLSGGGVRILAQVTVHGVQGGFIVDTGASVTELDTGMATKAGLTKVGAATRIGAVSCTTSVQPVKFDQASVGSVKLPAVVAASSENAITDKTNGQEQGLLGADILSTFGAVTFDFLDHKVVLG